MLRICDSLPASSVHARECKSISVATRNGNVFLFRYE